MKIFGAPKEPRTIVTNGRFELERDGKVAFLEYSYDGSTLELIHTEVPDELRGSGLGSELVHGALEWARQHKAKVDILCPFVKKYVDEHPEYAELLAR
jgi:uncharacterized protein